VFSVGLQSSVISFKFL